MWDFAPYDVLRVYVTCSYYMLLVSLQNVKGVGSLFFHMIKGVNKKFHSSTQTVI